jgi:hypothetical protein
MRGSGCAIAVRSATRPRPCCRTANRSQSTAHRSMGSVKPSSIRPGRATFVRPFRRFGEETVQCVRAARVAGHVHTPDASTVAAAQLRTIVVVQRSAPVSPLFGCLTRLQMRACDDRAVSIGDHRRDAVVIRREPSRIVHGFAGHHVPTVLGRPELRAPVSTRAELLLDLGWRETRRSRGNDGRVK